MGDPPGTKRGRIVPLLRIKARAVGAADKEKRSCASGPRRRSCRLGGREGSSLRGRLDVANPTFLALGVTIVELRPRQNFTGLRHAVLRTRPSRRDFKALSLMSAVMLSIVARATSTAASASTTAPWPRRSPPLKPRPAFAQRPRQRCPRPDESDHRAPGRDGSLERLLADSQETIS
jgi:hypothetical protein